MKFIHAVDGELAGCSVLDVGTGTAEVAMALASHLRTIQRGEMGSSRVLGVDPSEGMITVCELLLNGLLRCPWNIIEIASLFSFHPLLAHLSVPRADRKGKG